MDKILFYHFSPLVPYQKFNFKLRDFEKTEQKTYINTMNIFNSCFAMKKGD
jgi:hypothetical protein